MSATFEYANTVYPVATNISQSKINSKNEVFFGENQQHIKIKVNGLLTENCTRRLTLSPVS